MKRSNYARAITYSTLCNRLQKVIGPAMGWNCPDKVLVDGKSVIGAVFIERCYNARYRLVRILTATGGERNISDALTNHEMMAFMDGLLAAFHSSQNIKIVRDSLEAWRDNAAYRNQRDNYEKLINLL